MTTKTTTPDALRQAAEAAAIKAAEAQALVDAADDLERAKAAEALAERDRATLAGYNVRALDQHVTDAHAALVDSIRELSVTQALAAHMTAINARSWAYHDATQAAGRLGRSTSGWAIPNTSMPVLLDVIVTTAERMAQDATDAARAELEQ